MHKDKRILLICSLLCLSKSFSLSAESLPPILDFYPKCQYQIIDDITVQHRISDKKKKDKRTSGTSYTTDSEAVEYQTPILLESLREQAKSKNADALVLTSRILKSSSKHGRSGVLLRFQAKLIGGCDDLTQDMNKPAPVNHQGKRVFARFSSKRNVTVKSTINNNLKKLRHPEIENRVVSIENGVYGVKLGESVDSVKNKLGDPSVEVNFLKNELVLGYGRSHWFYFQSEMLVRIDTKSALLDVESLNQIPLRNFFDDRLWKINNKVGFKTSSQDVGFALNLAPSKVNREETLLKRKDSILKLRFMIKSNPVTGKNSYDLGGFSLQKANYKPSTEIDFSREAGQYKIVNDEYKNLSENETIDFSAFQQKMGKAAARIILSFNEGILIYSPQLYIKYKNNNLSGIHFSDRLIDLQNFPKSKAVPWELAGLYQGQAIEESIKKLPANGFEANNSISYESDNYELEVRYDKIDGVKKLLELGIYIF
ncbi:MAG: hypothetical protein OQK04_18925 [Kangiellaceae bacterium]|nr:hypothetical protein [Kangiellaceae bacterium]MCW9000792.1 hypothetical protein [Kangiellaceae bacterium]